MKAMQVFEVIVLRWLSAFHSGVMGVQCRQIGDGYFKVQDIRIECYVDSWIDDAVIAAITLCVLTIGYPLVIALKLMTYRCDTRIPCGHLVLTFSLYVSCCYTEIIVSIAGLGFPSTMS